MQSLQSSYGCALVHSNSGSLYLFRRRKITQLSKNTGGTGGLHQIDSRVQCTSAI